MNRFLFIFFTNNDTNTLRKSLLMVEIDCGIEEEQVIIDAIVNNKDGLLDIINKYQNEEEKADFARYYQNHVRDDIASLTVEVVLFLCSDNTPTDTCNRCIQNYELDHSNFDLFARSLFFYSLQDSTFLYGGLTQSR